MYVDLALPPSPQLYRSIALSLANDAESTIPPIPFGAKYATMRGAVAARLGRAEEELSEAISRCLIVGTEAAADDDQRLRREGVSCCSQQS